MVGEEDSSSRHLGGDSRCAWLLLPGGKEAIMGLVLAVLTVADIIINHRIGALCWLVRRVALRTSNDSETAVVQDIFHGRAK